MPVPEKVNEKQAEKQVKSIYQEVDSFAIELPWHWTIGTLGQRNEMHCWIADSKGRIFLKFADGEFNRQLCEQICTSVNRIDALTEIVKEFEENAWDGDPMRREADPLCIKARAALAGGKA